MRTWISIFPSAIFTRASSAADTPTRGKAMAMKAACRRPTELRSATCGQTAAIRRSPREMQQTSRCSRSASATSAHPIALATRMTAAPPPPPCTSTPWCPCPCPWWSWPWWW
uniref:HMA1 n=1 Tax=Arundo donax TaxID=35708 RepID=A0A0A9DCX5_ARUDO